MSSVKIGSIWAGPPGRVTTDMELGFCGREFWEMLGQMGSPMFTIAACAHWQAGKVERHNQTAKDMFARVVKDTGVNGRKSMVQIVWEVCQSKNMLVREHGWSPNALVFGQGRGPECLENFKLMGNPFVSILLWEKEIPLLSV